jgi:LL-diaminopimelate aminotransferase
MPLIGSKEGIVNIALALVNPGEVVLVPNPGYIAYDRGAILAGGVPHPVRLKKEEHFLPSLDEIPEEILKKARLLWINYPNNPTGAVASLAELREIVEFCRDNGILLCSDNPYADVTFDGNRAPSVMQIPGAEEIAVEFNSLSKTYNMAGWRVGVCVGNAAMIDALLRVKSNIDSGLFRAVQDAACVALNETDDSWLDSRNMVYQKRRDVVLAGLAEAGLSAESPEAGLYIWAAVDDGDDVAYARDALEEAFVSVSAGSFYGSAGSGFIRLSLVVTEERVTEAMRRLAQWRRGR